MANIHIKRGKRVEQISGADADVRFEYSGIYLIRPQTISNNIMNITCDVSGIEGIRHANYRSCIHITS